MCVSIRNVNTTFISPSIIKNRKTVMIFRKNSSVETYRILSRIIRQILFSSCSCFCSLTIEGPFSSPGARLARSLPGAVCFYTNINYFVIFCDFLRILWLYWVLYQVFILSDFIERLHWVVVLLIVLMIALSVYTDWLYWVMYWVIVLSDCLSQVCSVIYMQAVWKKP